MRKKDVYSLDPFSELRTNQQFSSFKLKNHTETAKSTVFGQRSMVFIKTINFGRKSMVLAKIRRGLA